MGQMLFQRMGGTTYVTLARSGRGTDGELTVSGSSVMQGYYQERRYAYQLTVSVVPSNATYKGITWSSSNNSVTIPSPMFLLEITA